MRCVKKRVIGSLMTIVTALTLGYGPANADLLVLQDNSKIYNHETLIDNSKGMHIKTKEGKEMFIPKARIKGSIYIPSMIDEKTADKLAELKIAEYWGEKNLGVKRANNFLRYGKDSRTFHLVYFCDKLKLPHDYGDMGRRLYFKKEEAMKKKKELEERGYDVFYRTADAAAGDPVIRKNLLEADLARGAYAAFHENMHQFVDFPLDLDEAASDVAGHFGSLEYLTEKYGKDSEEFKKQTEYIDKIYTLGELVIEYYDKLDDALKSNLLYKARLDKKEELMDEFAKKLPSNSLKVIGEPNNASLAVLMTYMRFGPLTKKVYEKAGSTKETVKVFKDLSDLVKKLPSSEDRDQDEFIGEVYEKDPKVIREFIINYLNSYAQGLI